MVSITIGGAALADPTPAEPAPEKAPPPYPRSLVDRPLGLPADTFEGTAVFAGSSIDHMFGNEETQDTVEPRGRLSFGPVELEAGGALMVHQKVPPAFFVDTKKLRSLFIAGHFLATPELSLGAEYVYRGPTSERKSYATRLVATYKQRLAPKAAVLGILATGFDHDVSAFIPDVDFIAASAEVRGQVQLSPPCAFEASVKGSYLSYRTQPDLDLSVRPEGLSPEVGARVVGSISQSFDVLVGFDLVYSPKVFDTPRASTATFSVGVAMRVP